MCDGPKNYGYAAYDLRKDRLDDRFRKVEFKCKGVVNNNASNRMVNYEVLKEVIIDSCCSVTDKDYEFSGELSNNLLSSQKFT